MAVGKKWAVGLAVGVGVLALAGPAGASTHHKSAPQPSKAAAGKKFLALVASNNAAIDKDKAEPGASGFPAISAAFSQAAVGLEAIRFPKADAADAKALAAILNKLSYDAGQVAKADLSSAQGLLTTVQSDEGTEAADSDALRHDLGLPAAKIPG